MRAVPRAEPRSRGRLASAAIVASATLGSSVLGFGREVVNARFYGTSRELDTFIAATTIPTIVFGLFNGALVSALVPLFTRWFGADDRDSAWRLASTILNVLALLLCGLSVLGWYLAPFYVPAIASGFSHDQAAAAVEMTRAIIPGVVTTSLAGAISALLNAQGRFTAAALQGVAINIATIAMVVILAPHWGIEALVWGTLLGLIAQLLVQLPALLMLGGYRPVLALDHPGLRELFAVIGPIVLGSLGGQAGIFLDRYFASGLAVGAISGMNYAVKLTSFPQTVFAAALATVLFPWLATEFARANKGAVRRAVESSLQIVNVITIPATVGLIVIAGPLVRVLFERGAFNPQATLLTASLVPYAAVGLAAIAVNVVLSRCTFACNAVWPTVAISLGSVVLNVALALALLPSLGARGLLLASSLSQLAQAVALAFVVRGLIGSLGWRGVFWHALRVGVAAGVTAAVIAYLEYVAEPRVTTLAQDLLFVVVSLALGGVVYVVVARALGVREIDRVAQAIAAKFRAARA